MSLETIEAEFELRLNQCWHSMIVADVAQLARSHAWSTVSRDVRAAAAVFAMAEFEALIKGSIEELHAHIETSGSGLGALRDGLRMLHLDNRLTAAAGSSLDPAWEARAEIASSHASAGRPSLPRRDSRGFLQPIGSQTPRPAAVIRAWRVYELPGVPFPRLAWQRSLGELADIRNDVAHRRERLTLAMAGRSRSADAIASHVLELRDFGKHVVQSIRSYADTAGYLRPPLEG